MSNFVDVKHPPLRAYNRAVMACNLLEDGGKAALEDYVSQFTPEDRKEMYNILALVKEHGPKRVISMVTHGLTFTDEDYVDASI